MTISIALLGASKTYGGTQALDAVDLHLAAGRVHALVGENGAGKSTATRLLAGLEQPTSGRLEIDGRAKLLTSRAAGIRAGVGLVPQVVSLAPQYSTLENHLVTRPGVLARRRQARAELLAASGRAGVALDLDAPVGRLGLAQRQLAELVIALAQGARILLLDEPTSALGPFETAGLFSHVRALAASGTAVLFITHRLDDVRSVADDVTVLAHGRVTLHDRVEAVTDTELVTALVGGRSISADAPRGAVDDSRVRLQLESVRGRSAAGGVIDDVSLEVRGGEIVGVLGVAGNGQGTLAGLAAGLIGAHRGSVRVDGAPVSHAAAAQRAGVAYIPETRSEGLVPQASVEHSVAVGLPAQAPFVGRWGLRWRAIRERSRLLLDQHDVRPRAPRVRTSALSGGNQQKLLVGRELTAGGRPPAAVIAHGPTQGLDIGAAAAIRASIRDAAAQGAAVLLITADLDEVVALSHRVIVIARGRVVDAFPIDQFDLERVGRAMAGLTADRGAA